MAKKYRRLTIVERKNIEQCMDCGLSINKTAEIIGCAPSTVWREVKTYRTKNPKPARFVNCFYRRECNRTGVCGDRCDNPRGLCKACKIYDCRKECKMFAEHTKCLILAKPPHLCNHCRHRRYNCGRPDRYLYDAKIADEMSRRARSESRSGIDMNQDRAEFVLARIKEGLSRGLSPYELSVLYETELDISRSTIYRWIEKGYGGLTNLELERKVGFKPRRKDPRKKMTSHSKRRSYQAFCELSEDIKAAAVEMDTVIGRNVDRQALLTLYHRPSDLQLVLPLKEKSCDEVKKALLLVKKVCPVNLFEKLFRTVLTDNGEEFYDEDGIGAVFGESGFKRDVLRLFYCDVRASEQKGSCEKNHSEIRQILKKGMFAFDELEAQDLAVVMSHANSNPREGLCGLSPIQMFLAAYGEDGQCFLDAFAIEQIDRDKLNLTPDILDMERKARGKEVLTRLK